MYTSDDIYIDIVKMYIYIHILFNTTCDMQYHLHNKNITLRRKAISWNAHQWLFPISIEAAATSGLFAVA